MFFNCVNRQKRKGAKMSYCIVFSTTSSQIEADKIATALLNSGVIFFISIFVRNFDLCKQSCENN